MPSRLALATSVLAALALLAGTPANAAPKAAYVQESIPTTPFLSQVNLFVGHDVAVVGTDSGTLGVSSLTMANHFSYTAWVVVGIPILNNPNGGCNLANVGQLFQTTLMEVYIEPRTTVHLPFPTPFVVNPIGSGSCMTLVRYMIDGTGGAALDRVAITVNGIVN